MATAATLSSSLSALRAEDHHHEEVGMAHSFCSPSQAGATPLQRPFSVLETGDGVGDAAKDPVTTTTSTAVTSPVAATPILMAFNPRGHHVPPTTATLSTTGGTAGGHTYYNSPTPSLHRYHAASSQQPNASLSSRRSVCGAGTTAADTSGLMESHSDASWLSSSFGAAPPHLRRQAGVLAAHSSYRAESDSSGHHQRPLGSSVPAPAASGATTAHGSSLFDSPDRQAVMACVTPSPSPSAPLAPHQQLSAAGSQHYHHHQRGCAVLFPALPVHSSLGSDGGPLHTPHASAPPTWTATGGGTQQRSWSTVLATPPSHDKRSGAHRPALIVAADSAAHRGLAKHPHATPADATNPAAASSCAQRHEEFMFDME